MKKITGYLKSYVAGLDRRIFGITSLAMALAVYINYHFHLNKKIDHLPDAGEYAAWYFIFLAAFTLPYLLYALFGRQRFFAGKTFIFLWLLAPAIFSWKMVSDVDFNLLLPPAQQLFWNQVIYWPFKMVIITTVLILVWKFTRDKQPFYGFSTRDFTPRPYLLMLLIMVPLIALASTQPDFLRMYPKLKDLGFLDRDQNRLGYRLIYELSYGSDFFSIELFFRGFLVLAFAKWFGKDAILPMACFYCTIHFGKPLGECISSFFGGMILGVVTYHTRTIWGGLMVHLGIAWLMELGGYIGHGWITGG
jgi:hypothetical protein